MNMRKQYRSELKELRHKERGAWDLLRTVKKAANTRRKAIVAELKKIRLQEERATKYFDKEAARLDKRRQILEGRLS